MFGHTGLKEDLGALYVHTDGDELQSGVETALMERLDIIGEREGMIVNDAVEAFILLG